MCLAIPLPMWNCEKVVNILSKYPHFQGRFERSSFRTEEGDSFKKREEQKLLLMSVDRQGNFFSFVSHLMTQSIKERVQS